MGAVRGLVAIAGACLAVAACGAPMSGDAIGEAQLPHPKAGLWRWTSQAAGVRQLCLSGRVLTVLAERPGCPVSRRVRTDDGAFAVEADCGGQVGRLSARAQGDFDRDFVTDVAIGPARDHAEFRYVGACAPGQKPDDAL